MTCSNADRAHFPQKSKHCPISSDRSKVQGLGIQFSSISALLASSRSRVRVLVPKKERNKRKELDCQDETIQSYNTQYSASFQTLTRVHLLANEKKKLCILIQSSKEKHIITYNLHYLPLSFMSKTMHSYINISKYIYSFHHKCKQCALFLCHSILLNVSKQKLLNIILKKKTNQV